MGSWFHLYIINPHLSVLLVAGVGAATALGFTAAIIDAERTDTLTASIVEPTVSGGAHGSAGHLALVVRHAVSHEEHGAVDGDIFSMVECVT